MKLAKKDAVTGPKTIQYKVRRGATFNSKCMKASNTKADDLESIQCWKASSDTYMGRFVS